MISRYFLVFCLYFYFYQISGLATTNILRLTAWGTLPVLSSECRCDNCGTRITPLMQMPIFSYLYSRGRCRSCGIRLPLFQLFLELTVFLGMSLISTLFRYSYAGTAWAFLYYEVIRLLVIAIKGKRKQDFFRQFAIAVTAMIPYWLLTLFLNYLYTAL